MCIFTSIEVLPTQETLPVNFMSQSGYIIFLHKSTRQTSEVTEDRSLISNIRKTGFSKTFLCSASGNTSKDNPEKTVVARDHTVSLQFLPYQTCKARTEGGSGIQLADGWQTHRGVQQNMSHKQGPTPPEQTPFSNEAKKLTCQNKTKHRSAGSMKAVFLREGKYEMLEGIYKTLFSPPFNKSHSTQSSKPKQDEVKKTGEGRRYPQQQPWEGSSG